MLVIGGLVARGMHRGGLTRTTHKAAGLRRHASLPNAASLLLPLAAASIPVIAPDPEAGQAGAGAEGRWLGSPPHAPTSRNKYADAIPVDVQAGSLGSGSLESAAQALRRGSPRAPSHGTAANLAARRTSASGVA